MRYKTIETIKVGDKVALPLTDENGRILVNAGFALTKSMIRKIAELGFSEVCIEDGVSEGIDLTNTVIQQIKADVTDDLQNLNLEKILIDANRIVDEVKNSEEIYEFFNPKTFDAYVYEHSVSVAVYSGIMGFACGFKESEVKNLVIAALLHDIGKLVIDPDILNKPGKLNAEEYTEIKKHSAMGFRMIKNSFLPSVVKTSVLQHHENEDGSGYPNHLTSREIYKFAKIIHICDVFDALVSKRPYKKAFSSLSALEFIVKNVGTMFDEKYVERFIQVIPVYKRGTIVTLSTGQKAIVLRNYIKDIYRPDVRLVESGEKIELLKTPDISIIKEPVEEC